MVSAVVGREVLQFFVTLAPLLDPKDNVEDQVVELFVTGMRECRVNPVVAALKEYETESMSVGLFATEHGNYQAVLTLLAMRLMGMVIRSGRQAGRRAHHADHRDLVVGAVEDSSCRDGR